MEVLRPAVSYSEMVRAPPGSRTQVVLPCPRVRVIPARKGLTSLSRNPCRPWCLRREIEINLTDFQTTGPGQVTKNLGILRAAEESSCANPTHGLYGRAQPYMGAWRALTDVITRFVSFRRFALVALLISFVSPTYSQVVGHTPGEFSVDPTGAATYQIPLSLPPGAAGMQPDLALLYHSRAGNGHLGVGWSVSGLSAITRCPALLDQDGVPRAGGVTLSNTDRFCLDGQPLRHQSGTYGGTGVAYFTEIQSFQSINSHGNTSGAPAHFTVTDRAGLTRHYGDTSDSRITSVGELGGRPTQS